MRLVKFFSPLTALGLAACGVSSNSSSLKDDINPVGELGQFEVVYPTGLGQFQNVSRPNISLKLGTRNLSVGKTVKIEPGKYCLYVTQDIGVTYSGITNAIYKAQKAVFKDCNVTVEAGLKKTYALGAFIPGFEAPKVDLGYRYGYTLSQVGNDGQKLEKMQWGSANLLYLLPAGDYRVKLDVRDPKANLAVSNKTFADLQPTELKLSEGELLEEKIEYPTRRMKIKVNIVGGPIRYELLNKPSLRVQVPTRAGANLETSVMDNFSGDSAYIYHLIPGKYERAYLNFFSNKLTKHIDKERMDQGASTVELNARVFNVNAYPNLKEGFFRIAKYTGNGDEIQDIYGVKPVERSFLLPDEGKYLFEFLKKDSYGKYVPVGSQVVDLDKPTN